MTKHRFFKTKTWIFFICLALVTGFCIGSGQAATPNDQLPLKGKLVGKIEDQRHGLFYVELYNENDGAYYTNLIVSKNEFNGARIGKNYEWNCVWYPDVKESISFHRI